MPAVTVSGIVTGLESTEDRRTVTVPDSPSCTGSADSDTDGTSSSSMTISTEAGSPGPSPEGRLPSDTVKVSSSLSASWLVETVPVALVAPEAIVMEDSEPWSPASAVPRVRLSGTVTALVSAADSVAVTVTGDPSATGFGDADSDTAVSSSSIVISTEDCAPTSTSIVGSRPIATVKVSSSGSASWLMAIVAVALLPRRGIVIWGGEASMS